MERHHLEQLLKANKLPIDASDDEVMAMLLEASYTKEEAVRALSTLRRSEPEYRETANSGNRKLFHSGERLNAGEISQLLGIDVTVNETIISEPKRSQFSLTQMMSVWLLSAIIAATAIVAYMYIYEMGLFHPMMAHGKE